MMYLHQQRGYCLKGCLIPIFILFFIYLVWIFWNWQQVYYIKEIAMYVQIERIPFCDVKMSFSRSKFFEDDYVKCKNTSDIVYMDIYYVPPQTIYVSGASNIKQNKFNIIEYKKEQRFYKRKNASGFWKPDYYIEYTDSTFLKKKSYHFSIYSYFSGLSVSDPNGVIIYKGGIER